jgi:methionyl aminopeptidase
MDVLREYTGHGIGRNMHEDPPIFNYGIKNTGPILRTGMTISIEPMITLGSADVYTLKNNWTVVTRDKSYGAHFEHTVCVRDNGCDILTKI